MVFTAVRIQPVDFDASACTVNGQQHQVCLHRSAEDSYDHWWLVDHAFDNTDTAAAAAVDASKPRLSSQQDVWEGVKPVIWEALQAKQPHTSILVCGAAGAGKSFTLFGDVEAEATQGLLPCFVRETLQRDRVEAVDFGFVVVLDECLHDALGVDTTLDPKRDLWNHSKLGPMAAGQRFVTCLTESHFKDALRCALQNVSLILVQSCDAYMSVQLLVTTRIWMDDTLCTVSFVELDLRHVSMADLEQQDTFAGVNKRDNSARTLFEISKRLQEGNPDWIENCNKAVLPYLLWPSLFCVRMSSFKAVAIACISGSEVDYDQNAQALQFITNLKEAVKDDSDFDIQSGVSPVKLNDLSRLAQEVTAFRAKSAAKRCLTEIIARVRLGHASSSKESSELVRKLSVELSNTSWCSQNAARASKLPYLTAVTPYHMTNIFSSLILQEGFKVFGSSKQHDDISDFIALRGPSMATKHGSVTLKNTQVVVERFKHSPIAVNGRGVFISQLHDGDLLSLGFRHLFAVTIPDEEPIDRKSRSKKTKKKLGITWKEAMLRLAAPVFEGMFKDFLGHISFVLDLQEEREFRSIRQGSGENNCMLPTNPVLSEALQAELAEIIFATRVANFYASAMERDIHFKLFVRGGDMESTSEDFNSTIIHRVNSSFWVSVHWLQEAETNCQAYALWSRHKFVNRYCLMETMFRKYEVDYHSDSFKFDESVPVALTPFYERPPHALIGVAYLHVDAAQYLLDIHDSLPILSFKGHPSGFLDVSMRSWINEIETSPPYLTIDREAHLRDFMDQKLIVKFRFVGLRGLPEDLTSNVYISFKFFYHPEHYTTPKHPIRSQNPQIDSVIVVEQQISSELIEYVRSARIELEVWGCREIAKVQNHPPFTVGENQIYVATTQVSLEAAVPMRSQPKSLSSTNEELRETRRLLKVQSSIVDSEKNARAVAQQHLRENMHAFEDRVAELTLQKQTLEARVQELEHILERHKNTEPRPPPPQTCCSSCSIN